VFVARNWLTAEEIEPCAALMAEDMDALALTEAAAIIEDTDALAAEVLTLVIEAAEATPRNTGSRKRSFMFG
jgi:hypothetical protein